MEEEFKVFLTKKEITVDEYRGDSFEANVKLVEAFALQEQGSRLTKCSVFDVFEYIL
jgi:hypothetical protein